MASRKGILLAGGSGTRLHPLTLSVSKQLLPVYNKPMIYYPLSVLLLAGIREVAIITTPDDGWQFRKLLGDGSQWGCSFEYITQPKPEGIAQAFLLAADFIQRSHSCLILGDNIFFGNGLEDLLISAREQEEGATVFGYHVSDPERYGVVEFDQDMKVRSLEEKPQHPKSSYAVAGLYFYDQDVVDITREIKPLPGRTGNHGRQQGLSRRGETACGADGARHRVVGHRHPRFAHGGGHVCAGYRTRQGLKVSCIEEIAWRKGYISTEQLMKLAAPLQKSGYGDYLMTLPERVAESWK